MNAQKQPAQWFEQPCDEQPVTPGRRWREHLIRAVAALGAGGGTIPFGDNGDVFRALATVRTRQIDARTPCS
jgi:hypothetical protein